MKWRAVFNLVITLIWCCPLIFLECCSEFFEKSLDGHVVDLLAPGDSAEFNNYNVNFFWDRTPDALSYRLQICSPNFDNPNTFYADTILNNPQFLVSLEPGKFQWRVKALNGSSESTYFVRSFTIFNSDFSKQKVLLNNPVNDYLTNAADIAFEWQHVFEAEKYILEVDTNSFAVENKVYRSFESVDLNKTVNISPERTFEWRVRAIKGSDSSDWSLSRTMMIDRTAPIIPKLLNPLNNAQVSSPVKLSWATVADATFYELAIYKSDSTTLYDTKYPVKLETTNFTFDAKGASEKVYWRVRAIDKAGNVGEYADFRSFLVFYQ